MAWATSGSAACRSTRARPRPSGSAPTGNASTRWSRYANRRAAGGRRCWLFGETTEPCGNCDFCCEGAEVIDGTVAAQKALSAIVRTGARFGTEHLPNILLGESTEAIEKFGHDFLPTFGVGKEYGKQEWRSIFRQLHGAGIIALDITGYGTWSMTETGRGVLKGNASVTLRRDTLKPATRKTARAAANAVALADGAEGGAGLFGS